MRLARGRLWESRAAAYLAEHGLTILARGYRCRLCGETWIDQQPKPLGDMRISMRQATLALGMLLEGMAIRAVQRLTGLDRNTLCDLILIVGENCQRLLDSKIRSVPVEDVQLDEIWSFVYSKARNVPEKKRGRISSMLVTTTSRVVPSPG